MARSAASPRLVPHVPERELVLCHHVYDSREDGLFMRSQAEGDKAQKGSAVADAAAGVYAPLRHGKEKAETDGVLCFHSVPPHSPRERMLPWAEGSA